MSVMSAYVFAPVAGISAARTEVCSLRPYYIFHKTAGYHCAYGKNGG